MTGGGARLDERFAAEQDERRRLAELVHDGPVQQLAAVAQMLDAAAHALDGGAPETAAPIVARALEVARDAAADLRELALGLEPVSLHEDGLAAALRDHAARVCERRGIACELDLAAAGSLGAHARSGLYQVAREALDQAVRRGPPTHVRIALRETPAGGVELTVADDGSGERRSAVLEGLAERAASLNGAFASTERRGSGTEIRVTLPPSTARR